ncbi:MAG: hypothetical protein WAK55_26320, partial [Xanthobacteraceae bacterium]
MDKPGQLDNLIAEVNAICADCKRSLRTLREWSTKSGALQTNSIERSFSEVDVAKFEQLIKDYRRALLRVVRASRGDPQKQEASARKLIWSSRSAHTCAALRATVRKNRYASPEQIRGMATAGKRWQPITEPVTAWWRPKSGGGYRLVTEDGIVRTAQRLVLRDMLTVMNIDSEFDYSRRGKGEKALITRVCDLMDSEFDWWAMLDIKNYFASLKPGHFGWLPLTRQEITNIVFTPKCAEVVVVILPKQMEHLIHSLKQHSTSNMNTNDDVVVFTTQLVRQGGLPQGAVHSPLLARGFVGRELQALFGGNEGIVGLSWV